MKNKFFMLILIITFLFATVGLTACTDKDDEITGTFYFLQDAYEKSLLTKEQLLSIAYYYNGGRSGNETLMSVEYTPIKKNPETLSAKTEKAIKADFVRLLKIPSSLVAEYPNKVWIVDYYGTYGDCVAVNVSESYLPKDIAPPCDYFIDGVVLKDFEWDVRIWIETK